MLDKCQIQKVEGESTAIQAGHDLSITNVGLSYTEVRQVALDVFRANFYELAGVAKDVARNRAEEITEDFLKKLNMENPAGLKKSEDPDFQYALFTVQKEYAKTGDKDLGDLLVDILVDRSKQDSRNIMQIVLNESLKTAPKLTDIHLATLAAIFLFRYTQDNRVANHDSLGNYFDTYLLPFLPKLTNGRGCFQHLAFSGCGADSLAGHSIESLLRRKASGLFSKGFCVEDAKNLGLTDSLIAAFTIPCMNDPQKIQICTINDDILDKVLASSGVDSTDQNMIKQLTQTYLMNEQEVKDKIIEIRQYMDEFIALWNNSSFKTFTLTSVGIAIGHANIKRLTGEFASLDIWIN